MKNPTPAQPYQPATFQERGVAVPFTTPVLGGTRVRAASRSRVGLARVELVVRNPADGYGVYVTPWTDGATLWGPTLHDRVLIKRIAALDSITPTSILLAAREIAAEGLCGDPAAQASRAVAETARSTQDVTSHRLLVALMRQIKAGSDAPAGPDESDLTTLARHTNDWIASNLHQPRHWAASTLEALAAIMTGIGEDGRIPLLIGRLRQTRADIADWSQAQSAADQVGAGMTCQAADLTLTMAGTALAQARLASEDVLRLLRVWAVDPAPVMKLTTRPEWLLDGWEQASFIWNYARDDAARRAALLEIADYVPVVPKEATEWSGSTSDLIVHRPNKPDADWRNGASVVDLIARNEHFRAIAL